MARGFTVKVEGLRELDRALGELPKATGTNVLRRVLKTAAAPVASLMQDLAPYDDGNLFEGIGHGRRLTRRQRAVHKKWGTSTAVEYFVGAGGHPQAITQEFGTWFHPAQPFARPAWDAKQMQTLDSIKSDLWTEIAKSAARHQRKLARQAAARG